MEMISGMSNITRREFVALAAGVALLPSGLVAANRTASKRRPNVVVLFIDDLAYGDVGAYGCPDIPTPHIDRLASEGVMCTTAYTACPVCSPSRTAIMTGRYTQEFGINGNENRGAPIPEDHPTLAEFMRDAGYVTGMVGRWNIGEPKQGPLTQGFMVVARRSFLPSDDKRRAMRKGPTYMQEDGVYWTDRQGDEMVDFVTRHKDEPFFLYFAPLAVHYPVQEAPQQYLDRVPKSVNDKRRREMAGTMIAVDDAVGKLMAAIKELALDEDTLVIFTSDNGGYVRDRARNAPFKGGKATPWEGAVRIPFIVRWPNHVPAGRRFDGMLSTMDVYATAAAVAGKPEPEKCRGKNLIPFMRGEKTGDVHEILYWRWLEAGKMSVHALRKDQWRLMKIKEKDQWQLYDIRKDRGERNNLAKKKPDIVKELAALYEAWDKTLPGVSGKSRGPGGRCPGGIGWATAE